MRLALVHLAALIIAAAPTPLAAQQLALNPFPRAELRLQPITAAMPSPAAGLGTVARSSDGNVGGMILGGVALGAAGLFGGALVGDRFQRFPCEDCIEGAFYGALAGESLAIPLGVHLADRRRGNLAPAIAASLGIGALGLGAAALTDQWGILLAVPVFQVAASIGIERHTARARP